MLIEKSLSRELAISTTNSTLQNRIQRLGLRMTPQRKLVLEAIGRCGEHATFEEIFAELSSVAPKLSRATLYRTLETFSRYRLIHGNEVAGGRVYELVADSPHHHLLCHNCWADTRLPADAVEALFAQIEEDHDFLVLGEHYIFMGLCPDCRKELGDRIGRFDRHPKFQTDAHKEEHNR